MEQNSIPLLIVDDDEGNLKALRRSLEKNYTLELMADPKLALERLKQQTFAVIICDLKMPHVTGIEFLNQASLLQPHSTRILLTAYSDPKEILNAVNRAEIYRYLTKPWEVPELIATVKQAYERFELSSHNQRLVNELEQKNIVLTKKEQELRILNASLEEQVDQRTRELQHANEKLKELAMTDSLTEILNRRAIFIKLEEEKLRADRYQRPFSVAMLDLDDFKKFNDKYGHVEGDHALKAISAALSSRVRKIDSVGRYGGEEFLILLPETKLEDATELCERLRALIEKDCPVKASMGVAAYPNSAKTTETLIEAADKALYEAKALGKNKVVASKKTS